MGWLIITTAIVDVDGSCLFSVDSQPKSIGLIWGLVATRRSVYIHQMNRVNSRNDCGHDNSTINTVADITITIIFNTPGSIDPWLILSGFVANSKYKIQALFKDFQGPKLHFSSTKIIDKKPYPRCEHSKFRLQCDTEVYCTVLTNTVMNID